MVANLGTRGLIEEDADDGGAVVIFRDETARREIERQFQEALTEIAGLRDRLEKENAYLQEAISTARAHHRIIGASDLLRAVVERIDLVAQTQANVLIAREAGTGKALVASEIHKASSHSRRSLIHFKCSSVAPEEVEAELFGQVRGASNDATRDKPGKLELARGGTLFLDGIEDVPPLAAHLLRVACKKLGRSVPAIADDVMEQLKAYTWPGNVRELHNVMERATIVSRGPNLEVEITGRVPHDVGMDGNIRTEAQMQDLLRANLIAALRKTNGKISGADGTAAM